MGTRRTSVQPWSAKGPVLIDEPAHLLYTLCRILNWDERRVVLEQEEVERIGEDYFSDGMQPAWVQHRLPEVTQALRGSIALLREVGFKIIDAGPRQALRELSDEQLTTLVLVANLNDQYYWIERDRADVPVGHTSTSIIRAIFDLEGDEVHLGHRWPFIARRIWATRALWLLWTTECALARCDVHYERGARAGRKCGCIYPRVVRGKRERENCSAACQRRQERQVRKGKCRR